MIVGVHFRSPAMLRCDRFGRARNDHPGPSSPNCVPPSAPPQLAPHPAPAVDTLSTASRSSRVGASGVLLLISWSERGVGGRDTARVGEAGRATGAEWVGQIAEHGGAVLAERVENVCVSSTAKVAARAILHAGLGR